MVMERTRRDYVAAVGWEVPAKREVPDWFVSARDDARKTAIGRVSSWELERRREEEKEKGREEKRREESPEDAKSKSGPQPHTRVVLWRCSHDPVAQHAKTEPERRPITSARASRGTSPTGQTLAIYLGRTSRCFFCNPFCLLPPSPSFPAHHITFYRCLFNPWRQLQQPESDRPPSPRSVIAPLISPID